jgi:hypothetical protein
MSAQATLEARAVESLWFRAVKIQRPNVDEHSGTGRRDDQSLDTATRTSCLGG